MATCPSCTQHVMKTLKARGIRVELGGCGCCEGNYAKIYVDGELVIDAIQNFDIEEEFPY